MARDLAIGSLDTLRNWVSQPRKDRGLQVGATTEEIAGIHRLRRGVSASLLERRNEKLVLNLDGAKK